MFRHQPDHIILMVAHPEIWEKDLCKYLEAKGFTWNNHKYSREMCEWVFIDITAKEMCMGTLGVKVCSPYINHAISFEDFDIVYEEYLETGRISDALRDKLMDKYKTMIYTTVDQDYSDKLKAKREAEEAEYQKKLKPPKTIISYEEFKKLVSGE